MIHLNSNSNAATTAIRVRMSQEDQQKHDSLKKQLTRLRTANAPIAQQATILDAMLNITAPCKASALAGLVRNIKDQQETIIFCRNGFEERLALQACHEAGKTASRLNRRQDDSAQWEQQGGIITVVTGEATQYPDLLLARRAVHLARSPNREKSDNLHRQLTRKGRRRSLEITHIIADNSADATIANAVILIQ